MSTGIVDAFPYVQSYWMMNQPTDASPALTGVHDTDVVVVGGGFAGLSTALGLVDRQPDLRVTIVEARHVGYGASGRNGGHILNLPPAGWLLEDLSKPENLENVHLALEMAGAQVRTLRDRLASEGLDAEFTTSAVAVVARNPFQVAGIRWFGELLASVGIDAPFYERDAAQAHVGFPAKAVLAIPTTNIQPYKLARALRTLVLSRGVTFFEDTPVTRIESTGNGVTVTTSQGGVQARRAVLTTNAYIRQNNVSLDVPLPKTKILHTYLMATEPLSDDELQRISPSGEGFGDAALSFFYGRVHDRRLLFGGLDRSSDNTLEDDRREASFRKLHREMLSRFPFLADRRLDAVWGGAVQETHDTAPIIRRVKSQPNLILNMGFGGNSGVNGTLFSGRLVPSLVLDDHDDPDARRVLSLLENGRIPWMGVARAGAGVLGALFR
ncbi:MAG: FAD-binding oxidoreductase [Myxococcota bacterium]